MFSESPEAASAAETVRAMFDAFNREQPQRDLHTIIDPEIVVIDLPQAPGPRERHGMEEIDSWIDETREIWDQLRIEPEEVTELDAERCLAVTRLRGRARGSGIEVDQRQGCAFFLRDGRICRIEMHPERERAEQALERSP